MKPILKLAITCMLLLAFSAATAQYTPQQNPQPAQTNPSSPALVSPANDMREFVMLKDGKLLQYAKGKETELKSAYVCSNGDIVSMRGVVTTIDGTTRTLKEGDKVFKDGHIEFMKENPVKQQNPPK